MDTHGHTRTATDVLCVLTDSHRQPRTSCVCCQTPTDVLCVLNRQPMWAKITQTVHEKGQRAEWTATDVLCVLMDTHGHPLCLDGHTRTDTHRHTKTHTDTHRCLVCAGRYPQTHKDTHRQSQTSCVCRRTATDVLCVLTDSHGRPVCADEHTRMSCVY